MRTLTVQRPLCIHRVQLPWYQPRAPTEMFFRERGKQKRQKTKNQYYRLWFFFAYSNFWSCVSVTTLIYLQKKRSSTFLQLIYLLLIYFYQSFTAFLKAWEGQTPHIAPYLYIYIYTVTWWTFLKHDAHIFQYITHPGA